MVEHAGRASLATFFFADAPLEARAQLTLGEVVARHLRARRLGTGATIALVDGQGRRATAVVVRMAKDAVGVEVNEVEEIPPMPPVHLLVPVADRDRMLWLAEKATELGITSWRPVNWRRSRSVSPRGEGPMFGARVRGKMVAALEQSGGAHLPQIFPDATPERAIAATPAGGTRLMLDPAAAPVFGVSITAPVTLALGPEGGLEDAERAELLDAGFTAVSIGPGILRFETAGAAGVAIARAALHHHVGALNVD
jgi:16S rRNA (uracil1498-N3)-methyltransferase